MREGSGQANCGIQIRSLLAQCRSFPIRYAINSVASLEKTVSRQIDVGQLAVISGGSGPPALLVHAYGANKSAWRHVCAGLEDTLSYIALDLPGSGASPAPTDYSYTLENLADSLNLFIEARDLRGLTIIAHSLGAAITLIALLNHKRTLMQRVNRLCLIAGVGINQQFPMFFNSLRSNLIGWMITELIPLEWQVNIILRYCYYDRSKITSDQVHNYVNSLRSRAVGYALRETARLIDIRHLSTYSNRLSELTIPCLLIWGKEDRVIPLTQGEKLRQLLPLAQLEVIDHCGHIPHEECPTAIVSAIRQFVKAS
jgi:pimeloyl-ACP methyl ester carboxylesterase